MAIDGDQLQAGNVSWDSIQNFLHLDPTQPNFCPLDLTKMSWTHLSRTEERGLSTSPPDLCKCPMKSSLAGRQAYLKSDNSIISCS